MKSNDQKNRDNFTIFLSGSIVLHLLLLYFFLFGMPSLFEKLLEEQTITFEMLPVSDKSNIITQTKQKEAYIENEDAKKSEQSKPKEEPQDSPKEEKAKEIGTKTVEEKPKIEEKKPIEEPKPEEVKEILPEKKEEIKEEKPKEEEKKQAEEKKEEITAKKPEEKPKEVKKKEPKTDELDSLLKNLEQSSEGDNVKSNKHKRSKKVDNAKEAKGVYTEGLSLSDSESSLIKRQIERHWSNIPAGVRGNNKVKVIISITLDKAGNVEQAKVKEKICPNIPASVCEALADNAIRAVWQASPIENLDPARFNHWKEINFSFNPSKL
ncbi:MAG: energy transducer TonB [Rickettsia endosymbiont of Ixodes persulcatus]|nr:energy transducer TonB [Rickettsia endosymbiont of Ixodes persulcatus]MCZ6910542.1 energy transducer TonB [Rickettsia endosymbiont of Ixodes persulcatus]MCZ6914926.1 energy transducer TonB [Rickettsia endosymbiont of Ixodes persulcatus]MCZ6920253.1 energy transducer TonB [Rickettsia endosymbiont of Ixodes persulcatus]MCZ6924112.1 energy transducer TonB [Rickettsia endosymbiont of Ixodes persulcatus]